MPQAELVHWSVKQGSDLVEIQAIVEDAVQVSAATLYDPPGFASGLCVTTLLWDEDITKENAPTQADIEKRLPWIPAENWTYLPPGGFDD